MAEIPDKPIGTLISNVLKYMSDDLISRYKAMSAGRGRLHRLAFDQDDPNAMLALDLIELPFDELVGTAEAMSRPLSDEKKQQLADRVSRSPIANQRALIAWLHQDVGCPHVGWFLIGAGLLRSILLEALASGEVNTLTRKSA